MQERNEFFEIDGIYWESDTHEWFNDNGSTMCAQTDSGLNKRCLT